MALLQWLQRKRPSRAKRDRPYARIDLIGVGSGTGVSIVWSGIERNVVALAALAEQLLDEYLRRHHEQQAAGVIAWFTPRAPTTPQDQPVSSPRYCTVYFTSAVSCGPMRTDSLCSIFTL